MRNFEVGYVTAPHGAGSQGSSDDGSGNQEIRSFHERFNDLQRKAGDLREIRDAFKPESLPVVTPLPDLKSRGNVSLSLLQTVVGPSAADGNKSANVSGGEVDWTSNPAETLFFKWEAAVGCLNSGSAVAGMLTENLNSVPALVGQSIFATVSMFPDILALRELGKQNVLATQLQKQVDQIRSKARSAQERLDTLNTELKSIERQLVEACERNRVADTGNLPNQDQTNPLVTLLQQVRKLRSGLQDIQKFSQDICAASDADSISFIFSSRLKEEIQAHQRALAISASGSASALIGSTLNLLSVAHLVSGGLISAGNVFQFLFSFYEANASFMEGVTHHKTDTILQNRLASSLDRPNEDQRMLRNVAKMARRQVGWRQSLWKGMSFFFGGISGLSSAAYFLGYFFTSLAQMGLILSVVSTGAGLAGAVLSVAYIIYKVKSSRAKSSEVSELRDAARGKQTEKLEEFRHTASVRLENKLAVRYLAEKENLAQYIASYPKSSVEIGNIVNTLCEASEIPAKAAVEREIRAILSKNPSVNEDHLLMDAVLAVFDRHANKQHRNASLLKKNPTWEAEFQQYMKEDSFRRCLAKETGMTATEKLDTSSWRKLVEPSLNDRARLIAADKLIKRDPEFALHAIVDQLKQGNIATEEFLRAVWSVPESDLEACRKASTTSQRSSAVGLLAMHMGILKAF